MCVSRFCFSIEPTWSIDLGSVFDNREGDDKMYDDKNIFLVTFAPEIGLRFTPHDRNRGGAVWTQPLENGVKNSKLFPLFIIGMNQTLGSFRWECSLAHN